MRTPLAAILASALLASAPVAAQETLIVGHLDTPEATAKAQLFEAIAEREARRPVALKVVADGDVVAAVRRGEAAVTFDAAREVQDAPAGDLMVLGLNTPTDVTVARPELKDYDPQFVPLVDEFFVQPSRLEHLTTLARADGRIAPDELVDWMEGNAAWLDNMLSKCPEATAEAACEGDAPPGYLADRWYGGSTATQRPGAE